MTDETHDNTRHRLLQAAAEVFAEQGFHAATIRDICTRAGANVAAVNYHFRDKQQLYREVFTHARSLLPERPIRSLATDPAAPPEHLLRAIIRAMLATFLSDSPGNLFGRLMAREMFAPTAVLDDVIEKEIKPLATLLRATIQRVAGGNLSPDQLAFVHYHLVAQGLFYRNAHPVISRLDPHLHIQGETLDRLATHIADFAIAGIKALPSHPRGQGTKD